jgi:hypothetical protein
LDGFRVSDDFFFGGDLLSYAGGGLLGDVLVVF